MCCPDWRHLRPERHSPRSGYRAPPLATGNRQPATGHQSPITNHAYRATPAIALLPILFSTAAQSTFDKNASMYFGRSDGL